jgi:hypothetical protein
MATNDSLSFRVDDEVPGRASIDPCAYSQGPVQKQVGEGQLNAGLAHVRSLQCVGCPSHDSGASKVPNDTSIACVFGQILPVVGPTEVGPY